MDLRLTLAILVGKIITFTIRFFGGGATAAPGLAALQIDPNLVIVGFAYFSSPNIFLASTAASTILWLFRVLSPVFI